MTGNGCRGDRSLWSESFLYFVGWSVAETASRACFGAIAPAAAEGKSLLLLTGRISVI